MTDKPPLIESLRRYGSDFISHAASRGIEDIEAAGELMLEAARVLAEPPAEQEPNWSHPKIQSLIGADARNRIVIDLIWRILESPNAEFTASDMEYWDAIHDAVQAAITAPQPTKPAELDRHQAFIDTLPDHLDDKMFEQIDLWARQTYKRHQSQVRGQMFDSGDSHQTHLIYAAFRWAKEHGNPLGDAPEAPQPAIPPGYKLTLKSVDELAAELYAQHPTYRGADLLLWRDAPQAARREWLDKASAILAAAPETPQPAKREPLTDADINMLRLKSRDAFDFARAIERAHGIGEQP